MHADEQRLRQILLNLLNNAIKFTEEGSVTLVVSEKDISPKTRAKIPDIVGFKGNTRKILIVDDHLENRTLLKDMLSPLGFDLVDAADGREALTFVKEYHPDLILMDLLMPVMDGFEATRQIREEEQKLRRAEVEKSRGTENQSPVSSDQSPVTGLQYPAQQPVTSIQSPAISTQQPAPSTQNTEH